jgi:wyosine [tRNA(Phe)-imidazoG37] synthetase (radical SAM superfamily)
MPSREEVKEALFLSLEEMAAHGQEPDIITFAGNGEPTLHPQFAGIIDDTIEVKNIFFPDADIAVLTNATTLNNPEVCNALKKIDKSILKLDSAIDSTIELHNRPGKRLTAESIITALENFDGEIIVQTMFIRGSYNNIDIDNTTEEEIVAWLAALNRIRPAEVQIYTVSRDTPYGNTIEKVSVEELDRIAERVKNLGIATQVSG